MPPAPALRPYALASIALVSCSMLMYEILLTRICALRLFFHFSFLVISNCLLAIGASGTMISIMQDRWARRPRLWIVRFGFLYVASLAATYAFLLAYPVRASLNFTSAIELIGFSLFNLVAALPFFFAGTVVGLLLTFNAERVNAVYGADLLGAGAGCLLCPLLLWRYGAGGCVVALALLGLAGAVVTIPAHRRRLAVAIAAAAALAGLWAMPRLDGAFPMPSKASINVTEHESTPVRGLIERSQWSATSRIDLVPVRADSRFIFARGRASLGLPLPDEKLILQDGAAGTFILNFSEHPDGLEAIRRSAYSTALRLKDRPRVFVIGVGGGNDVWAALAHGADRVRGIELNWAILDIHRTVLARFSRALLADPRVELVWGEGRSALMRDRERYDVIQMTGIDTWTALTSGAYMLAENYLYTREAVTEMLDHLAPDGILQIIRFAADMEALRLLSIVHAAFEFRGRPGFEKSVAALRTPDALMAVLVRNGAFTDDELASLGAFAHDIGLDIIYLPGTDTGGMVEGFVHAPDKATFVRDFPRDISPTTDDRPYFFNFTKWRHPFPAARPTGEPTVISQGNPAFILGQLALSTALALGFILLPLVVFQRRGVRGEATGRFLVYFGGLGLGFIAIELAVMQKFTLLLGQPLYSVTVTLFAVLVFTGVGSLVSVTWFAGAGHGMWRLPLGLAALVTLFVLGSPRLVSTFIGASLPVRAGVAVAALAPISLLLGAPFAYGIRRLRSVNPALIPWAWGVNGCFTVVGSIVTVVLSMTLGFDVVLLTAAAIYLVAFAALPRPGG